jgi:glyoxylate/hydroxypyruvate reductase A
MSIVLVGTEAGDRWREALAAAVGEPILSSGDPQAPDSATIAVVAGPLTDSLARFEKLELVLSLQAGVESLLRPGMVPDGIEIARVYDPSMRVSMVESVLLHVLSAHRQSIVYRAAQRERRWLPVPQPSAAERRVGVLGLGELGAAAATAVAKLGFPVTGWSRSSKVISGVDCLWGEDALSAVLSTSDILVSLLPLTGATIGLLGAARLAELPQRATVISLGRGGQVDEAALIEAIDRGHLSGAILDVFSVEPLPSLDPLWGHDRVIVYPHVAADPHPSTAAVLVADLVRRHRSGDRLGEHVDRVRGY